MRRTDRDWNMSSSSSSLVTEMGDDIWQRLLLTTMNNSQWDNVGNTIHVIESVISFMRCSIYVKIKVKCVFPYFRISTIPCTVSRISKVLHFDSQQTEVSGTKTGDIVWRRVSWECVATSLNLTSPESDRLLNRRGSGQSVPLDLTWGHSRLQISRLTTTYEV